MLAVGLPDRFGLSVCAALAVGLADPPHSPSGICSHRVGIFSDQDWVISLIVNNGACRPLGGQRRVAEAPAVVRRYRPPVLDPGCDSATEIQAGREVVWAFPTVGGGVRGGGTLDGEVSVQSGDEAGNVGSLE